MPENRPLVQDSTGNRIEICGHPLGTSGQMGVSCKRVKGHAGRHKSPFEPQEDEISAEESKRGGYDMNAEPLLHGLLQRGDLSVGVKADVEVALADIETVRAERDRYGEALRAVLRTYDL